jgi:hypothetical protein
MSATAQAKKDRGISRLMEARRRILEAVSLLPPEKQEEVFLGVWSAKDLLAHLVGWDLANVQAVKEILAGKLPGFYSHYDRDWKTFNASLVTRYKQGSLADLVSLVRDSHEKLICFLKTIPAGEFDKDRGLRFRGHKVTIAGILKAEADDEKTHYTQLIKWGDK